MRTGWSRLLLVPRDTSRFIRRAIGIQPRKIPVEASDEQRALIEKYAPYTMTSRACQWALLSAIEYIDRQSIPGDIVECGVWRGGNMMMANHACRASMIKRRIYLFDTFAGMTEPAAIDRSQATGSSAIGTFQEMIRNGYNEWCYVSLPEVKRNFIACGLDLENTCFIEGPVEKTLLDEHNLPKQIGVLRLDTDWYASTKMELEILYPRLAPGGVLFIDDYGSWQGSRAAVDEYFRHGGPLLYVVDGGCRGAVKIC